MIVPRQSSPPSRDIEAGAANRRKCCNPMLIISCLIFILVGIFVMAVAGYLVIYKRVADGDEFFTYSVPIVIAVVIAYLLVACIWALCWIDRIILRTVLRRCCRIACCRRLYRSICCRRIRQAIYVVVRCMTRECNFCRNFIREYGDHANERGSPIPDRREPTVSYIPTDNTVQIEMPDRPSTPEPTSRGLGHRRGAWASPYPVRHIPTASDVSEGPFTDQIWRQVLESPLSPEPTARERRDHIPGAIDSPNSVRQMPISSNVSVGDCTDQLWRDDCSLSPEPTTMDRKDRISGAIVSPYPVSQMPMPSYVNDGYYTDQIWRDDCSLSSETTSDRSGRTPSATACPNVVLSSCPPVVNYTPTASYDNEGFFADEFWRTNRPLSPEPTSRGRGLSAWASPNPVRRMPSPIVGPAHSEQTSRDRQGHRRGARANPNIVVNMPTSSHISEAAGTDDIETQVRPFENLSRSLEPTSREQRVNRRIARDNPCTIQTPSHITDNAFTYPNEGQAHTISLAPMPRERSLRRFAWASPRPARPVRSELDAADVSIDQFRRPVRPLQTQPPSRRRVHHGATANPRASRAQSETPVIRPLEPIFSPLGQPTDWAEDLAGRRNNPRKKD